MTQSFVNDYDEAAGDYLVRCLNLADGKEIWRFKEKRRIRPNHAITRTVPATDGKLVFTFDPKAVLHALDAATGREVWRKDLVQEYGSQIPPWYNGQCPLLEKDRVVIAPVGQRALTIPSLPSPRPPVPPMTLLRRDRPPTLGS